MSINIGASPIVKDGLVLSLDASSSLNYNLQNVEVLVVAGGGGGGANHAGGGGGGGLIYRNSHTVTPGTPITVTVGNGGATPASSTSPAASNGQNSVFDTLVSSGGGGGGNRNDADGTSPGRNGGSGGGGGGAQTQFAGNYTPGNGVSGQGFAGGRAIDIYGGGGGGAGGKGFDGIGATLLSSGNGGPGLLYNISGSPRYYAGGGGAGYNGIVGGGLGGVGGAGRGGIYSGDAGTPGQANTGGGGGGGGAGGQPGSAGGSGVVIVRYPGPQKATGGTITNVGGYTIHTFTSSGTFTPLAGAPANAGVVYGLQDLSGNNNTGTQSGGVTYNSANGGALNFDGSNDYIDIPTSSIPSGNQITISVWNYGIENRQSTIIGGTTDISTNPQDFNIHLAWSDGNVYWDIGYPFNRINKIPTSAEFLGWHHWAFTKNANTGIMQIYNDGNLFHSGSGLTSPIPTMQRVRIGAYQSLVYFHLGRIGPMQIYNRVLTAAEILKNFNVQRGRFGI